MGSSHHTFIKWLPKQSRNKKNPPQKIHPRIREENIMVYKNDISHSNVSLSDLMLNQKNKESHNTYFSLTANNVFFNSLSSQEKKQILLFEYHHGPFTNNTNYRKSLINNKYINRQLKQKIYSFLNE